MVDTQMTVDDFLRLYPLTESSPARTVYEQLKCPPAGLSISEEEYTQITAQKNPKKLMIWIRRNLDFETNRVLCEKLLTFEEEAMLKIQQLLFITCNEHLINNSIYLFLHSKQDPCAWLMDHLHEMRYPYAQSAPCLVLGFRGNRHTASYLMYQVRHLDDTYWDKSLLQAPLLALHELKSRFPDL